LKRLAAPEFATKDRRIHPQRQSSAGHQHARSGSVDAQDDREADHPFTSAQADFKGGDRVHRHHQRHEAGQREINEINLCLGDIQDLTRREIHAVRCCEYSFPLIARHSFEQAIVMGWSDD
jgi:hypothetical protein